WVRWLPPDLLLPGRPAPARALLAGVALTLFRLPGLARSAGFWREVSAWWAAVVAGHATGYTSSAGAGPAGNLVSSAVPPSVSASIPAPAAARSQAPASLGAGTRLPRAVGSSPHADAAAQRWVETALGGALYLVNFMQYTGLPAHLPEGLGAWAALEGLARGLLSSGAGSSGREPGGPEPGGPGHPELVADPIWRVLALLDGREPDAPPGGLADWAAATASIPPALDPGTLLPPEPLQGPLIDGLPTGLNRWLTERLPYIRLRLVRALHPVEQPEEHLLLLPARLSVSVTHLDLLADINQISIPVRLAGLDRDPGWAPAFGRVIRFHYT
ncbi:MAG TPA: hypothetical protein VD902_19160, partial [Symbiobacteriaceae bacterium]|nr:hypothetical protein [Symbiobacteriaceae bacterium]